MTIGFDYLKKLDMDDQREWVGKSKFSLHPDFVQSSQLCIIFSLANVFLLSLPTNLIDTHS